MSTIVATHIEIDDNGVAWIDNTKVKVIEIIVDKLTHGSSAEEMRFQYPHLSLAQIHAALAYYYDHQTEMEVEIERRWKEADELATNISDSSFRQKLLTLKKARAKVEPSLITYRQRKGSDTWHWCRNCSTWPKSDYEKQSSTRPSTGELCNECISKQKASACDR
jgi:uncharacterized protein (DUF433 family)